MKKIVSRKMIKPSTPTPQNLKNYQISLTDQLYVATNVPIVLFYSPAPPPSDDDDVIDRLQKSLADTLPRFYPLAGRFVKEDHVVLCNDDGVDFVEAYYASPFKNISEYAERAMVDHKLNDVLLTRPTCEADDVSDPMASIQVTRFPCGGLAIGLSISHKIFDANSVSTFISAWAQEANKTITAHDSSAVKSKVIINPNFDGPKLLPFTKIDFGLDGIEFARTVHPDIIAKRFSFDKEAISALKAKVIRENNDEKTRRVSKVNAVCALILKAVIHVDKSKHGKKLRTFLVNQAVNIRDRTIPPFPKHSCGNIIAMSVLTLSPEGSNVKLEDLVSSIRDAIEKTVTKCSSLFDGEGRYNMLYDPFMEMTRTAIACREEARVMVISDWTKFEFYEADFGWGKPFWTSIATMPVPNMMVLLGNKEGDGIEAWVHLFKEEMVLFEQQYEDIMSSLHA